MTKDYFFVWSAILLASETRGKKIIFSLKQLKSLRFHVLHFHSSNKQGYDVLFSLLSSPFLHLNLS